MSNPSILVVDDEPAILQTLSRVVRALFPHAAIDTAIDGDAAAQAIEGGRYSLLITDYYLGATTGAQLAEHAKAIQPNMAVLMISGDLPPDDARNRTVDAFVRKPFELSELFQTLRQLAA